jgi:hypothetical protein
MLSQRRPDLVIYIYPHVYHLVRQMAAHHPGGLPKGNTADKRTDLAKPLDGCVAACSKCSR